MQGAVFDLSPLFAPDELGLRYASRDGGDLRELDPLAIIEQFNRHGLLSFTGFKVDNESFRRFVRQFCASFFRYVGATHSRTNIDDVEGHLLVPPQWMSLGVPAHAETTYMRRMPFVLWFHCRRPAPSSGETTLYDGAAILRSLPADLREQFTTRKITYSQSYPREIWGRLFGTESLEEVQGLCQENGVDHKVTADPRGEPIVHTHFSHLAIIEDRFGRAPAFANHIFPTALSKDVFPTAMTVKWEDGTPLDPEMVLDLVDLVERFARPIAWKAGDIVMIDNTRVMHGARSYFGRRETHLIMTREPRPELGFRADYRP